MCQQLIGDINHVRGYRYFTRVQLRLLSGLKSLIKHHSSCSKQYSYFHALANVTLTCISFWESLKPKKVTCFFVPSTEPSSYT